MTYRVRKQAITGKLILQRDKSISRPDWHDALPEETTDGEFHLIHPNVWKEMNDRITRYERRAEAQRTARAARANRQPKEIA